VTDRIPFPQHAWPLLRKALEHIAAHPDEFYMGDWLLYTDRLDPDDENDAAEIRCVTAATGLPLPACGTVACLAGRIVLLSGDETLPDHAGGLALGLMPGSSARSLLEDVFDLTDIRSYAQLRRALEDRFTFPEPLPEAMAVPR
jgi:hypothetical protein